MRRTERHARSRGRAVDFTSPLTHALLSGLAANGARALGRRERGRVALAGVVPDLDGVGAIPQLVAARTAHPVFWGTDYHHVLGHNLLAATVVAGLVAVCSERRAAAGALTLVLAGRRGFGPLEVVWPAADRALVAVAGGWLERLRWPARGRRAG